MKADCINCKSYSPAPAEERWLGCPEGKCLALDRKIWDVTSRNCDGLYFERKSFEVDNGDNGARIACNDCGVTHE